MALAWLNVLDVGRDALRFAIDTGTSRYYQLQSRARALDCGRESTGSMECTSPRRSSRTTPAAVCFPRRGKSRCRRRGSIAESRMSNSSPTRRRMAAALRSPTSSRCRARRSCAAGSLHVTCPTTACRQSRQRSPCPFPQSMSTASTASEQFQAARKIPCVQSPDSLARRDVDRGRAVRHRESRRPRRAEAARQRWRKWRHVGRRRSGQRQR